MKGDKRHLFMKLIEPVTEAIRSGRPRKAVYLEHQTALDMSYQMFCRYVTALVEPHKIPAYKRKRSTQPKGTPNAARHTQPDRFRVSSDTSGLADVYSRRKHS